MEATKTKSVLTPRVRLNFPNLYTPKMIAGSDDPLPKYSAMLVFSPQAIATPEFEALKQLARDAVKEKWPSGLPQGKVLRSPFRKGKDRINGKVLQGLGPDDIFMNVSSRYQPEVVDQRVQKILNQNDVYSGCFVRVSLNAYAYDKKGNAGVSFGLGNVQKVSDGPRLGGGRAAADEFTPVSQDELDAAFGADEDDPFAGAAGSSGGTPYDKEIPF